MPGCYDVSPTRPTGGAPRCTSPPRRGGGARGGAVRGRRARGGRSAGSTPPSGRCCAPPSLRCPGWSTPCVSWRTHEHGDRGLGADPALRRARRRRLGRPLGRRRRDLRPARPERGRQDDDDPAAGHAAAGGDRRGADLRTRRADPGHGGAADARLRPPAAVGGERAHRAGERRMVRAAVRRPAQGEGGAGRRGARPDGSHRVRRPAGRDLLRRHGPPPGAGPGAGQPAGPPGPGRADGGPRPGGPRQRVGPRARTPGAVRDDGAADHPLHGGGRRPLRPGGTSAPGPAASGRCPGRAQGRARPGRLARGRLPALDRRPARRGGEGRAARCPCRSTDGPPSGLRGGRGRRPPPRLFSRVATFCLVELQKLRHDRSELFTRMIQPILWLVVFGQTFTRLRAIPTGDVPYLDYLAPGIIAQSALFVSIFYGIQIIWERDAGVLTKLMVTPTPRAALVTGKAFAAGIRSLAQALAILVVSLLLGVRFTANPLKLLGVLVVVLLGAAFFCCLSVTIAGLVLKRDRLMGIGQAIMMPLFFASNALYPVTAMPQWLQVISAVNPLSYEVSALRGLLLGTPTTLWLDFLVLIVAALGSITAASALLGRLTR